jgi:hypothetical protein
MSSATVVEHAASKKSGDAGAADAAATATAAAADAATSPPPPDCSLLTHLNHVCRAIIIVSLMQKKIPAQKQVSRKTAGSMDQSHRFKKKSTGCNAPEPRRKRVRAKVDCGVGRRVAPRDMQEIDRQLGRRTGNDSGEWENVKKKMVQCELRAPQKHAK